MSSSLGQVPNIQDRNHREYLKRLGTVVTKLENATPKQDSATAASLRRLQAQLNELQQQVDGSQSGGGSNGTTKQDDFVADAEMLSDKQVLLSAIPVDPMKVELIIYSGIEQKSGVDFYVSGQYLRWDGLALETLLEVGNSFSARYVKTT